MGRRFDGAARGGCGGAGCESGEKLLRDAVMKKQLYLRGFSAEDTVRWHWDGSSLVLQAPRIRTMGVMTAASVWVKGNKVVMEGDRQTLAREGDTKYGLFPGKDRMRLEGGPDGCGHGGVAAPASRVAFLSRQTERAGRCKDAADRCGCEVLWQEAVAGPEAL